MTAIAELDARRRAEATRSAPKHRQPQALHYTALADGFRLDASDQRSYEANGIVKTTAHLRCVVRAQWGTRSHVDSLDLYSARARQTLMRACTDFFEADESVIVEELARLLEYADAWQRPSEGKGQVEISDRDREAALAALRAPNLLERISHDLGVVGMVGEEENRLLGYLAALSRKLEEPLSLLILSRSSAGKSRLADTIARFVPPEDLKRYTRVTGQALFYASEEGLKHKLVAIEEAQGAQDAAYSIRTLQSSGELRVAVTTKDPRDGRLKTEEYTVKGPAAFLLSSTASTIDAETQSRFLVVTVDESEGATARILAAQRDAQTVEGLRRKHEADATTRIEQTMQRLLEPLAVVNPYAPKLHFPTHTLRARRDQKKYLALIQTVTLLHQHQRERKTLEVGEETVTYIETTIGDILAANRLAVVTFSRTLDEVSPQGRALLGEIRMLCEEQAQGEVLPRYAFRRRDLRRRSGWSETQLRQYLGELVEQELVEAIAGRQGKEYVYHLAYDEQGRRLDLGLATEEELVR